MALLKNRAEAAERLLILLAEYITDDVELFAIPRGGVPIAYVIAKAIGKQIEVVMVKKIGHPAHPEYAIGAVTLQTEIITIQEGIPASYIQSQIKSIRKKLEERYTYFMGNMEPNAIRGKTVIIVDDGIATGNSMLAAIQLIRSEGPKKIIVAAPIIPPDTMQKLQLDADEVVYLYAPEPFLSVGRHYDEFRQLTDQQVKLQLSEAYSYANE
tara:strand:+ start:29474 stop:30109 length:636 start_codon:yes stop_codon:yes gene_type:complete